MSYRLVLSLVIGTCAVSAAAVFYILQQPPLAIPVAVSTVPQIESKPIAVALGTNQESSTTSEVRIENRDIIDSPLHPQSSSEQVARKIVQFKIDPTGTREPLPMTIIIDTKTFAYRAETTMNNGFTFTHANGIVCFRKPTFEYTYCLREKYTPLALTLYILGDQVNTRELTDDEKEIYDLMNDLGWTSSNIMAAMMMRAETALRWLRQGKLRNGEKLTITWTKEKHEMGVIGELQELSSSEKIETAGIHLAAVMQTMFNSQSQEEMRTFPVANFEDAQSDLYFVEELRAAGISISTHWLKQ